MAMDPLAHVRTGQPFETSAAAANRRTDAARRALQFRPSAGDPRATDTAAIVVMVLNEGETTIPRFRGIALTGTLADPATQLQAFQLRPAFRGLPKEDPVTRFVVTQEPIPPGRVGRAVISGVTVARISVLSATDTRVGMPDDTALLQTSRAGSAELLFLGEADEDEDAEGDEAEKDMAWAVILLGARSPNRRQFLVHAATLLSGLHNRWDYELRESRWNPATKLDEVVSGGLTIHAFNRNENGNTVDIVAPGYDFASLPAGWQCYPVSFSRSGTRVHKPVEVELEGYDSEGDPIWFFCAENAIDGPCPEPEEE